MVEDSEWDRERLADTEIDDVLESVTLAEREKELDRVSDVLDDTECVCVIVEVFDVDNVPDAVCVAVDEHDRECDKVVLRVLLKDSVREGDIELVAVCEEVALGVPVPVEE
jgi:hypothetical protein